MEFDTSNVAYRGFTIQLRKISSTTLPEPAWGYTISNRAGKMVREGTTLFRTQKAAKRAAQRFMHKRIMLGAKP